MPGLPFPDIGNGQWIIGYQYFGGFTQWSPPSGTIPGTHSPVKLSRSLPYWCLAADLIEKVDGKWGTPDQYLPATAQAAYQNLPQHRQGNHKYPEGGNEVFVDCSARFCKIETMCQFTTWYPGNRKLWFYQNTADITARLTLQSIAVNLKWKTSDQ